MLGTEHRVPTGKEAVRGDIHKPWVPSRPCLDLGGLVLKGMEPPPPHRRGVPVLGPDFWIGFGFDLDSGRTMVRSPDPGRVTTAH